MRMTEIRDDGGRAVDGYGPGFFRVGGQVHRGAMLVLPTGPVSWGGWDDVAGLTGAAGDVDVVLVGTGAAIAHPPVAFRTALEDAGLGMEPMATPAACRTFNLLLSEGRRVALAVLPV